MLLFFPSAGINRWKPGGNAHTMKKLFSVYKVENGTKILLGGIVERRKSKRGTADRKGLMEMAKQKFAEPPGEEITIIIKEEK